MKISAIKNNFNTNNKNTNLKQDRSLSNFNHNSNPINKCLDLSDSKFNKQVAFGNYTSCFHSYGTYKRLVKKDPRVISLKDIYNELGQKSVSVPLDNSGKAQGLNKIVGLIMLKMAIYRDVLTEPCIALAYRNSVIKGADLPSDFLKGRALVVPELIPNGLNFFGPKGCGKTFFARQLGEHYNLLGGHFEELDFFGDAEKDSQYLKSKFTDAKIRFLESGKEKYSMYFIDEIEKKFPVGNSASKKTMDTLLNLTENCKDNGVIFISAANYLDKVEPELLKTSITDMKIPIDYVAETDFGDIIKHYLKSDKLPFSEDIQFDKIQEEINGKGLRYKPKDIEHKLLKVAKPYVEYGGELSSEEITEALINKTNSRNNDEILQFLDDKDLANELGGVYEY